MMKEVKKIYKSLEYNKAEEQKLLQEYERTNYKFSLKRNEEMKKVKDAIYDDEIKILELEEEIEKLSK